MPKSTPLRVCVGARMIQEWKSGGVKASGGVKQTVIGLAADLSALSDSDEEYFFLTYPEQMNRSLRARSDTEDLRIRRALG